ncbi:hypothetical protein MMC08_003214 [Hypocenomyce scalaris]|nr:hypothetical protein [Hypocenomyce scalaris]
MPRPWVDGGLIPSAGHFAQEVFPGRIIGIDHSDPAAIRASTERLTALRNAALKDAEIPRPNFLRRVQSHPQVADSESSHGLSGHWETGRPE